MRHEIKALPKSAPALPSIRDFLMPNVESADTEMHRDLSEPTEIRHGTHLSAPEIALLASMRAAYPDSKALETFAEQFMHMRVSLKRSGRLEIIDLADKMFVPLPWRMMRGMGGMGSMGGMGNDGDAGAWFK